MNKHYVAIDIGAESGRAMLGSIGDGSLVLEELHRFSNTPVRVREHLHWDAVRLFHEFSLGIGIARRGREISGIGVDTWGVDFALLDADGDLIGNPVHYRDARTNGMMDAVFERVPKEKIFAETGIQFMQINTLYQLYAMRESAALARARTLLFMPDLFNYWLTGSACAERTITSTSQFYNPREKRWAKEILSALDLPSKILPEIVDPGARLGNFEGTPVFATGCHDTASAVAAVPSEGESWCYISSGTWSLMGVELDEPVINDRSLAMNLTNEIGARGRVRLLRNIAGLWPLQECRRAWSAAGNEFSYEELSRLAKAATPFAAVVDPDAFLEPGDMPGRIEAYCRQTGQTPPELPGEFTRAILEGLALRYREVLDMMESLLGRRLDVIHIVGGGSRNAVLNQFVADCTGRVVLAGPAEATAIGNVLIQAIGAGDVANLEEGRALVRRAFPLQRFKPTRTDEWNRAYETFTLTRSLSESPN